MNQVIPHPSSVIPQAQACLPLDDDPAGEPSLRDAFVRSGLRDLGYTFERAIADETRRRCLININIARLRARTAAEPA